MPVLIGEWEYTGNQWTVGSFIAVSMSDSGNGNFVEAGKEEIINLFN